MKVIPKFATYALLSEVGNTAKVPKDSPVRKVFKLRRFAENWLKDTFGQDSRITQHWIPKFKKNANRFKDRYEDCPKSEAEFVAEVYAELGLEMPQDRRRRQAEETGSDSGKGKGKGKKERKGKRNRMPKAARIPVEFRRYDKTEPLAGIESIMRGFHIWADRYVSECSGQPHTQQNRAIKWVATLKSRFETMKARAERRLSKTADDVIERK